MVKIWFFLINIKNLKWNLWKEDKIEVAEVVMVEAEVDDLIDNILTLVNPLEVEFTNQKAKEKITSKF